MMNINKLFKTNKSNFKIFINNFCKIEKNYYNNLILTKSNNSFKI